MAGDAKTYVTISEAADKVGIPSYVLRFWESKFPMLQPMRLSGGRRYYRQADLDLLSEIKRLVHEKGYSLRGARIVIEELLKAAANGKKDSKPAGQAGGAQAQSLSPAQAGVTILQSAAKLPVTVHLGDAGADGWLAIKRDVQTDASVSVPPNSLASGDALPSSAVQVQSQAHPIQHESVTQLVKFLVQELRELKKLLLHSA
ncbi:MAG: MerR family transcriptional regulator [Rhodospirillaceae bacterium]|nr:MerR family transcriptional regulator [Rhodospirillaceae bacterium]